MRDLLRLKTEVAIILVLLVVAVSTCTKDTPLPPPVQGPAVLADAHLEIFDWEYLGPDAVDSLPSLSAKVREVGDDVHQARLVWKDDGFELVWGGFVCATQPVVVVHNDLSIEFWPGEILGDDCIAREAFHKLTVELHTSIPLYQLNNPGESPGETEAVADFAPH
jgi:hypothetical protein